MLMVDELRFRERGSVGRIVGEQTRHGGLDLPSFRLPEGKPYVLLVCTILMRLQWRREVISLGFERMRIEEPDLWGSSQLL